MWAPNGTSGELPEPSEAEKESRRVQQLLALTKRISDPDVSSGWKVEILERVGFAIQPQQLRAEVKHSFVQLAVKAGIVETSLCLIEKGRTDLTSATCNFLGDLVFNSVAAGRAVLGVFDRIIAALQQILEMPGPDRPRLLYSAASLCANIVATCPEGEAHLAPLIQTVFLPIVQDPASSDRLLGNTVLLLANLSLKASGSQMLRASRVASILLDLVLDDEVPTARKSVAESVVIFLLGGEECAEIDRLMQSGVVDQYCLPIMERALAGEEFRGMYPHLVYSAHLFEVLARSKAYAEVLVAHDRVVPLLLRATRRKDGLVFLETDDDGRRLALEALASFTRFQLWPRRATGDALFFENDLPLLLADDHVGVRATAASLWARLHVSHVSTLLMIGNRLQVEGKMKASVWVHGVVAAIFPVKELLLAW